MELLPADPLVCTELPAEMFDEPVVAGCFVEELGWRGCWVEFILLFVDFGMRYWLLIKCLLY